GVIAPRAKLLIAHGLQETAIEPAAQFAGMGFGQIVETKSDERAIFRAEPVVAKPSARIEEARAHDVPPPSNAIALGNRNFDFNAVADFRRVMRVDDEGRAGFGKIDEEGVFDAAAAGGMLEAKAHIGAILRPQNIAWCTLNEFFRSFTHG